MQSFRERDPAALRGSKVKKCKKRSYLYIEVKRGGKAATISATWHAPTGQFSRASRHDSSTRMVTYGRSIRFFGDFPRNL